MATTTNYGWTTPDDTALVKDGAAAIRTLGSSVDTTTKNLNPETTLGDIAYRSSTANVNTRLALGTAGQVLKVNSGATAPEWAAASGFTGALAYTNSGSVTYVANVEKILNATSEEFDTDSYHSTATNTERMTIPAGKGGKYLINAHHRTESGGDYAYLYLFKNGSRVTNGLESGQSARQINMAGNSTVTNFSAVVEAVATDYFYITFQSSFSATSNTWFRYSITYLGA